MASEFKLSVEVREVSGKGASRRLRREQGLVPGIIYGGTAEPVQFTVPHKDISKALEDEGFYSHLITLNVGDQSELVILKDLQRHPAKPFIQHIDFQRVDAEHKITVHVPIHFLNEDTAPAVKQQGGAVSHQLIELELSCLPKDLPEFIEVDMHDLELGATLHISDIKLPEGVSSVSLNHGSDLPVANIHAPKGGASDEETEDSAAE